MILYIENPKDATRRLLEVINEFGKVAGYKINAQKSLAFLYTNDEKSESEIKKTLPGLPSWRSGWESTCQCRGQEFEPWSGKIPHAVEQLGP